MAKDIFHNHVREALEKDGWEITNDPYFLYYDEIRMETDLGAEKLIAATKNKEKIVVEVKSFVAQSKVYEWHAIVGQFEHYQMALEKQEPERILYLAIPHLIYNEFFQTALVQDSIKRNCIKLFIFDIHTKEIISWIK